MIPTESPASPLISNDERLKASDYLTSTRESLLSAVADLGEPGWSFKPTSDQWSILEILEHIVLIENRIHAITRAMPDSPAAEEVRDNVEIERVILTSLPERSTKRNAPEQVRPAGRWTAAQALHGFVEGRMTSLGLLAQDTLLRGHICPHPFFGPWDGYQWLLAAAAHTERHIRQIYELKSSPGFPQIA